MRLEDATEISRWHYPQPYTFYDAQEDASDLAELLTPTTWAPDSHFAVDGSDARLMGFFTFDPDADYLVVGIGLRPDATGRGLGEEFLRAGLQFAADRWHPAGFKLAVAEWNARAIRVYERAGFVATGRFLQETNGGVYPFIAMMRLWPSPE